MLAWLPIFYYSIVFLPVFLLLLFLSYLYLFGRKEFFWKCFYFLFAWSIIFIFLFNYSFDLFLFFIEGLQESLVVTDPTVFVNLFFYFSFYLSLLFFIPYLLFLILTYLSACFYKIEYSLLLLKFFLIFYYISVLFWVVDQDLFLSSWYSFSFLRNSFFDFQPDFEKFLYSFWADYFDLLLIFSFYFWFYFLLLKNYFFLFLFRWQTRNFIFLIYFIIIYYFFGEGNFPSDLFLFVISYLVFDLHGILISFLSQLRRLR